MQIDLQCATCKHLTGDRQCEAFPKEIPDDIFIDGDFDHTELHPDQEGTTVYKEG